MTFNRTIRGLTPPALMYLADRLRGRPPKVDLPPLDPSVAWFRSAIPGWLSLGNIADFEDCIRAMPAGAVVEIGSWAGLSLVTLSHFIAKHRRDAQLFSADPWILHAPEAPAMGNATAVGKELQREVLVELFDRSVRRHCPDRLPHAFELPSDDFFRRWDSRAEGKDFFGQPVRLGGPIAFAYIDGNHDAEPSWRDFENVDRHLAPGGFVLFDDSFYYSPFGCRDSAKRAAERNGYRLVSRRPNYCVQKVG